MMMLLILIMVVMIWMNLLCSRCMQRISESVIKCWTGKSERRLPCAKHWGNVEEEDSDEDFWRLWWGFRWFWFGFGGIWGFFFEDCEDYDEDWEDDEKKRMTKIRDSGVWGKPSQRRGVRANVRSTLKLGYDDHHDHYDSRSWCLWWWRRLIYIGAVYGTKMK